MNRVVGDALLNRRTDERWSVTCVEYPRGLALLQRTGPMTRVIVSDSANTFAGPDDPDAYSAAVCTPDGELAVVVRNSPPAIGGRPDRLPDPARRGGRPATAYGSTPASDSCCCQLRPSRACPPCSRTAWPAPRTPWLGATRKTCCSRSSARWGEVRGRPSTAWHHLTP